MSDLKPEDSRKRKRKRLKKLCAEIRQQMEFYFSDANLHKSKFLGELLEQSSDGYLDIEIFGRCNKLRSLTTDMNLVAKALSTSDLLQVSDDKTKVKRTRPLSEMSQSDVDDRTVYVECLPASVTHDWIKQQFSSCGNVVYVSVPKFRTTGDPKGFAFVEFSTKEEAEQACETLNNPPASASENVGKFPRGNKQLNQLRKQVPAELSTIELSEENVEGSEKKAKKRKHEDEGNKEETKKKKVGKVEKDEKSKDTGSKDNTKYTNGDSHKELVPETKKRKRRHRSSECSVEDSDGSSNKNRKVAKTETEAKATEKADGNSTSEANKNKKDSRKRKSEITLEGNSVKENKKVRISDVVEVSTPEPTKKKRKRKRKTKEKNRPKDIPEVRVIPKQEWLKLRKEYLELQKKSMTNLKKSLNALKHPQKKKDADKQKTLEFMPNVIVKVESDQPTSRKMLKESLGNAGNIAYIDVDTGEHLAHIRCFDAESAKSVATAGIGCYTLKLLQGEEEKNYWNKLQADREKKFSQPRMKKKGTQKMIEKADRATREMSQTRVKHVFFED